MIRFVIVVSVIILVFISPLCFGRCELTLGQRVRKLEKHYFGMKKTLEKKVIALETKIKEQEIIIKKLQSNTKTCTNFPKWVEVNRPQQHVVHRTCHEIYAANSALSSGMYWIDPDGQGVGDDPIHVYCDVASGSTSVLHDSESKIDVGYCTDPGCYSRKINYQATKKQIEALVELSQECHQSIKYECINAPLSIERVAYSWWDDKNGNPQYFWSGNNASVHTCQCGIDHNCHKSVFSCNCDSVLATQTSDSGIINDKNVLPITRLRFGRIMTDTSSGFHTLGRLECSGQVAVKEMPSSCEDLWRKGHTLSGFYSVLGEKQIENVHCDFTKLPKQPRFQTWVGYSDVKSSPTFFYVQKNSSFTRMGTPIPFEIEKLNIGGAINRTSGIFTAPKAGMYFFSLTGVAVFPSNHGYFDVALVLNGIPVGRGECMSISGKNDWETYSIQSILNLRKGDQISTQITALSNSFMQDNHGGFTHFSGWLLQEDISQSLIIKRGKEVRKSKNNKNRCT